MFADFIYSESIFHKALPYLLQFSFYALIAKFIYLRLKEGFETKKFQPETSFNPVSVLNLFGLLGWAVDAATGAMMKYNPKVYEIKLEKKAQ